MGSKIKHFFKMADKFHVAGIPAMALTANTARDVRKAAVMRLRQREVNLLCVVDLFNEGWTSLKLIQ